MLDVDYEIDENIVRGLDYYDHDVWEYYLEDGSLALGGGGRYNNLVGTLGGPDIPAVGFAFGIDRIIALLKDRLSEKELETNIDAYIMAVSEEEKLYALKLSQDLRLNNIITEYTTNNLSLKSQFKIADSLNAKFLIILNNEDLQKGLINIKDNATKEETKIDESSIIDYLLSNI